MLTPPNYSHTEKSKTNARKPLPNKDIPRRIDMCFVSRKRSKGQYSNGWVPASPEDILAEKYQELAEPDLSLFNASEYPYYLHGICFKLFDMPADTMKRRRCIELRIDGENVVIEVDEKKLFVIDYHKGIKYELVSSFKSRVTTNKR